MIDYLCFSGTTDGRVAEYVEHLHEHFLAPPVIRNGHYMPPSQPGFSIQMTESTLGAFATAVGAAAGACRSNSCPAKPCNISHLKITFKCDEHVA